MEAVYRLIKAPANFNFVEYLVCVKTLGASEIVLDDTEGYRKKYTPEETRIRMESIVEPACDLAGVTFRYGKAKEGAIESGYGVNRVHKTFLQKGFIAKLKTVKPPVKNKATVTIRNQNRHEHRNSTQANWRQFAKEIGAAVIEDWNDKPIHLHDRMALYAGAEMNYFVSNGPASLCLYSDYPYTCVINPVEISTVSNQPKGRFAWAVHNQRAIVCTDDWNNIWPLRFY